MTPPPGKMAERLAEFAVKTHSRDIPPEIYDHAKVAFMDWLGVTYGGMDDPLVEKVAAYAAEMGGHPQATVLGRNLKTSVDQAALINGTASHVLDYDDTLVSFFGHPSVTLYPSLLALSEWRGKSGRDLLCAYLVGLQVGGTIGVSAGLDHYMAGWHATSIITWQAGMPHPPSGIWHRRPGAQSSSTWTRRSLFMPWALPLPSRPG